MGSHRVGHDWSDLAAAAAEIVIKKIKPMHFDVMAPTHKENVLML